VYLAARPSVGKSATAIAIAVNVAKAGHGVLYVSLEMTLEQIEARIASAETYISGKPLPYDRALNRQFSNDERERFVRAGVARNLLPIAIEERPGLSTVEIAARVRKTAQELANKGQRLGLVVIDLLGKVKPRDLRAPLVQQLGEISNELSALAKSENIALLVLHQLNRGVEGRENKRPNMSDLRDSGNLEQDADNVWLLYRPAYYLARAHDGERPDEAVKRALELEEKKHILEIDVAKNRNGAVGTVDAFCDLAFNIITDIDKRHA
jgi:replicative DNA helicase